MVPNVVLASASPRLLGVETGARVRFGEEAKVEGAWAGRRLLFLDDKPAFELSFWCGTCQFLFKREHGANETVSLADVEARLAAGVDDLDEEVISAFAALLPLGEYVPLLLQVQPRLVRPVGAGDYFAEEQVATWGVESFWGLPEYPRTPYYRTYETAVAAEAHLFEFVVPMVPPSWNDADRVEAHRERLDSSSRPTAVGVSTLDVCAPAEDWNSTDYFDHSPTSSSMVTTSFKRPQRAADRFSCCRCCLWRAVWPTRTALRVCPSCGRSLVPDAPAGPVRSSGDSRSRAGRDR